MRTPKCNDCGEDIHPAEIRAFAAEAGVAHAIPSLCDSCAEKEERDVHNRLVINTFLFSENREEVFREFFGQAQQRARKSRPIGCYACTAPAIAYADICTSDDIRIQQAYTCRECLHTLVDLMLMSPAGLHLGAIKLTPAPLVHSRPARPRPPRRSR